MIEHWIIGYLYLVGMLASLAAFVGASENKEIDLQGVVTILFWPISWNLAYLVVILKKLRDVDG